MNASLEALTRHCEQEALALSGAIQPHGALVHIRSSDGRIGHASANLHEYCGQAARTVIGQDGRAWLASLGVALAELPGRPGQRQLLHAALSGPRGELDLILSANPHGWLVEMEPAHWGGADTTRAVANQARLLRAPDSEAGFAVLQCDLVEALQDMTGYDRVMLYRFHPDWSGEVVAEVSSGAYGSYLGLRFPASDIPAIARQLYVQTPYRHIPEVGAEPVPLIGEGEVVDQTWSDLRSVSPVHMQYLRNMQVGASFSISVVLVGQLWGLIACHHRVPRPLSLGVRALCAEVARGFTLALTAWNASQRARLRDLTQARVDELIEHLSSSDSLAAAIEKHHEPLLEFMHAGGGALVLGDELIAFGDAPRLEWLERIDHWFSAQRQEGVHATDRLAEQLGLEPEPERDAVASGVLGLRMMSQRSGLAVRLYWFRPEEPREVAWAGNPNKPVELNPGGMRFSPRHSFERWVEIHHGHSNPWTSEDLLAATLLRAQLSRWL